MRITRPARIGRRGRRARPGRRRLRHRGQRWRRRRRRRRRPGRRGAGRLRRRRTCRWPRSSATTRARSACSPGPGYAEDGSTDKSVDWVTPFEEETGCEVNVKYFGTSDEAVTLMKTGEYDVVSASGDATLRLIAGGDVEPVNTDLIPNYADVWPLPQGPRRGTPSTAQSYGIAARLRRQPADVQHRGGQPRRRPTGAPVFDGAADYTGKVTAYDSPIYIADAALYLMNTQPDLGIENPYALDEDQLAAAVDLLKAQREHVGEYWSDYLKEIQAFTHRRLGGRHDLAGDRQPRPGRGRPGRGDPARERLHRLVGHLDDRLRRPSTGTAPTRGSNHIVSPEANAAVAEWFGEAPANAKACDLTSEGFCETYHAGDEAYAEQIWYWTTPIEQCLDGRTDVECTTYQDWTQAWTEIKG